MESGEEDSSIVLSEERMRRVEVPGDGSCLFWAVALPYLIQVNNNPDLFSERFERLFGANERTHSHHVRRLINEFHTSDHNNSHIYDDEILRHLVTRVFRHKLVDHMSQCENEFYECISIDDFIDMKNEAFITDGTFRTNFEKTFFLFQGTDIDLDKLKPEVLDEETIAAIDVVLDKMVKLGCRDLLQNLMFRMYLEAMRSCSCWGGKREIDMMKRMLGCEILINFEKRLVSVPENSIICLFNNQRVHYQFFLIKAQFLIELIDRNSEENCLEYLKIGVDEINFKNSNGSTLLHFAAKSNHVKSIHFLINQGAELNIKNHLEQTPIDIATSFNSHAAITALNYCTKLYSSDVGVNSKKTDELHLESDFGETSIENDTNLIIKHTVLEHEISCNVMGRTTVHREADAGDDIILGLVLAIAWHHNHVSPSTLFAPMRGERKLTALHLAAKNNRVKAVEMLLENKADVHVRDVNSEGIPDLTPLHYAAEKGHLDIVKLLIEKGKAEIDAPDRTKGTPLQRAVRFGQLRVVEYLVGAGANVNSRDENSISVLSYAAKAGCLPMVRFLVEKGAEINAEDKNYVTPLHHAAMNNKWEMVKYLAERGADLKVNREDKKSAVIEVISAGQWRLAKALIEIGASTEGEDALLNLICLGNSELLEKHINDLVVNNPLFLNEFLPEIYNEIQLLNIPISQSVSLLIESHIIKERLFSHRKINETSSKDDADFIKQRISLIIEAIERLRAIYLELSANEISEAFLLVGRVVAQNMQTLKNELHFTYDKLPWIEMQFCIVNFLSDFFAEVETAPGLALFVLNKARLMKHLMNFRNELQRLEINGKLDNKYPFRNRKEMVDSVVASNSSFKELYEDYELLRDVYSLNRIESYLNPACVVDLKEGDALVGEQVILRALQVTGECLKNTIESPNMSDKVHRLLIQLAPENVIKIVTSLRDSLSHVEHLHKGKDAADQSSLLDIQKDLIKLKEEITFISLLKRHFILEVLLKRISECENVTQVKEILVALLFRYNELTEMDLSHKQNEVFNKVEELIENFKLEIPNPTSIQQFNIRKLEIFVEKHKVRFVNAKQIRVKTMRSIDRLMSLIAEGERRIDSIRKIAKRELFKLRFLMIINKSANCFDELLHHSFIIYNSCENHSPNCVALFYEISQLINFEASRVKSIDRFRTEMAKEMNFDDEIEKTEKIEEYASDILENIWAEISDDEIKEQFLSAIEIKKEVFRSKNKLINYYSKIINEIYNPIVYFYDDFGNFYNSLINFFNLLFDFYKKKITVLTSEETKFMKLIDENLLNELYSELNLKNLMRENAFNILMENIIKTGNLGENNFDDIFKEFNFEKLIEDKKLIDENLFKTLLREFGKNKFSLDEAKVESLIDQSKLNAIIDVIRRDLSLDENIFRELIDKVQFKLKKGETSEILFSDFSFSKCKTMLQNARKVDGKFDSFGKLVKEASKESEIAKLIEPFNEFVASLNVNFNVEIDILIGNAFEKIKVEQITLLKKYFFQKLDILLTVFPNEKTDLDLLNLLKTDDNIRIAVEMLVLNLTETLNQLSLLEPNRLFLDEFSPVLVGKNLRNYLAHGDPLINILLTNYHISLINHFRLFQREFHINGEFYPRKQLIGRVTEENLLRAQHYHDHIFKVLLKEKNLFNMSKNSKIEEVKKLINNSSYWYLKFRNSLGDTLLHFSARANNCGVFQYLFQLGLSVFFKNKYGHSAIHTAISTGSERITEFLLNKGFDSSFVVENGETLLHVAVQFEHLNIVKLLLRYGADIEAVSNRGSKPIIDAVVKGHDRIVIELLNAGSDVESTDKIGRTLLHLVLSNFQLLKTLLQKKINVNALDENGNTPLHLACSRGAEEIVKLLLDNEANVNHKDKDGATALHHAAKQGHAKIVELLLLRDENVNIDARTTKYLSALHVACFNGHFDVVDVLLRHGADFNLTNGEDMTALHVVASIGHARLIDILLDYPLDIDGLSRGRTALHIAADSGGGTEVFKKLVERGANIFLKGIYGFSVLHLASLDGNIELMEFILAKEKSLGKFELINATAAEGETALHAAIETNRIKTVDFLIDQGADLEAKDFNKMTPIIAAASNGYADIFNLLLSKGANINVKYANGRSLVHAAANGNNKEIINALIRRKMSVDAQCEAGVTPLHLASQNGHLEMVKLLLKIGARIDLPHSNGFTALHFASFYGHEEIVRYLLKKNAKNDIADSIGCTPVHWAVENAQHRVLEVLLDNNNKCVNARNTNEFTALHVAAENGSVPGVNLLLNNGANVNATCKDDLTSLHLAAMKGHEEVVSILVTKVANVNVTCKDKLTSLHLAAMKGHEEVVSILVTKVANVDAKRADGCTALHLAAKGNYFNVVETMIRNGARVNCVDNSGRSALHFSSAFGYDNTVLSLLKLGAKVKALDNNRMSALHCAANEGHIEIVRVLLAHGAEVNRQNKFDWTPLHMATNEGHDDIVQLLLANKASPNLRTKSGSAALHLASEKGFYKIVEHILKCEETEVDLVDVKLGTPLFISTTKGFTAIVQLLLKRNANANAFTEEERLTPLHLAAYNGHFDIARLLLDSGADVEFRNKGEHTPLHAAVVCGHLEVAQVLIKGGADVFAFDDHDSVLHKAVENEKMLEFVLKTIEMKVNGDVDELGKAINVRDKDGDTPLMWAAATGQLNAAKLLLKCDVIDVNIQNFDGLTALHWAAQEGHRNVVEFLIANKINACIKNKKGQSALDVAVQLSSIDTKYEAIAALLLSLTTST